MSHLAVSGFHQEDWGLEFSLEVETQDPFRVSSLNFESDPEYYASELVDYLNQGIPNQDFVSITGSSITLNGYKCSKEYLFEELVDVSCSETMVESLHDLLSGL